MIGVRNSKSQMRKNAFTFETFGLSNKIEQLTSLNELSDLVRGIYENRMQFVDEMLPYEQECPRCDVYRNWIQDLYDQSDYLISIINEFDDIIDENKSSEDCHCNCDQSSDVCSRSSKLQEKYNALKQKYHFVKNKNQMLNKDKEQTIQTLDSELDKLIHEQMSDKDMIKKLNLELLAAKKDNKDKDLKIETLKQEFNKIVKEYESFKLQIQAECNDLLKKNFEEYRERNHGIRKQEPMTIEKEQRRKRSKSIQNRLEPNKSRLETYYLNETYPASSTQVVFTQEKDLSRRNSKIPKKI
ncbi:hypothetical protein M8J76_010179 [Diaphorina citri]|nr:hypothetical protein M8J76_010179 [Diaphorina citri]